MAIYNPFAKHESHSRSTVIAYQVLAFLSWALVVVTGVYYSIHKPHDVDHGHNIWKQAERHLTPFSQHIIITAIYWIVLLLSQISYQLHFFVSNAAFVTSVANVAPHFILNNLFVFAFILLWVRSYFWGGEAILALHVLSQSSAYWIHFGSPSFVHLPAIAGPYAWSITALFWNGAVAIRTFNHASEIAANVFIWVIFLFGFFHIFAVKDYGLGFSLSFLLLSLAVEQFRIKIIALQWIFGFIIFAVFFISSWYVSYTAFAGRNLWLQRIVAPEPSTDREREPLLNNP